ncbi:MAG TPA: hypothetical protein VGD80_01720 [Kofleriaceae bacterium]
MTRRTACVALAALAASAACGDGSRQCGAGTMEIDGVCVPSSMITCGDGTKLDNAQCVVDPESCQAGTVLIGHHCVDPTSTLVVDLEESAEPNGGGIALGVEASPLPAGTITLKAPGVPYVIHGRLTPFRDADGDGQLDPDFDTYLITVTAPTLLAISVDGTGGAQGAFYAIGDARGPVPAYERYGLNLTGDTSQRRLFLPAAGLYRLAITDTRSLAVGKNRPRPAGSGGAAGSAAAEYYASITVEPMPAPTAIAISETTGTGTAQGALATDEVELFTARLGGGVNDIREDIPGAAAAASLAVVNLGQLAGYADENPGPPATAAEVMLTSITPGDSPLIVVDTVYHYGPGPEPFTLTVTVR